MAEKRTGRIPAAILGATGAVGQTFIWLLKGHPWIELVEVAASERSLGQRYGEAVHWLEGELPGAVAGLTVLPCTPEAVSAPLVFSALDAAAAASIEPEFARAGRTVVTNARNHRMDPDVPLVIPEVNPGHLALIDVQRERRGWEGAMIANGNCSSIVITLALVPLQQRFGIRKLFVTTMQALFGAGYPGVPSLDIAGNVVPYIGGGEEEKIETEILKMLGEMVDDAVKPAKFPMSAQVNRVPVEHGHTACIAVGLERNVSPEEAAEVIASWCSAAEARGLPSAPERPVMVARAIDRPQPRRDAHARGGMTVTVGRMRRDPILDLRLVAAGHNTIRGAAGATLLNAEFLIRSRPRE